MVLTATRGEPNVALRDGMGRTKMTAQAGRRGGRSARRAERLATPVISLPTLVRNIPVYEVLDEEGLELVHDASMRDPRG